MGKRNEVGVGMWVKLSKIGKWKFLCSCLCWSIFIFFSYCVFVGFFWVWVWLYICIYVFSIIIFCKISKMGGWRVLEDIWNKYVYGWDEGVCFMLSEFLINVNSIW